MLSNVDLLKENITTESVLLGFFPCITYKLNSQSF